MKEKKKQATFIDCGDGRIVELVGQGGINQSQMFVIYEVLHGKITFTDRVQLEGTTFVPPKDDLVANGTVLLPTYPQDYGSVQELANHIEDFIYRYLDISGSFRRLATFYVLLTWVYDCFETIPYLRVLGDFGTGKTRFQKVIGSICYKSIFAGGATTPSPIFRIIELYRGTLVIDEADFRFSDKDAEIVKILNCGHTRGIPVLRTEGKEERMPKSYNVYGPKIIATRSRFKDQALESRCFTEIMEGNPRPDIPLHLPKEFYDEAEFIRNLLLMFRLRHYGQVELKPKLAIPNVEPRVNQILLPLLSIIEQEDVLREIKKYAREYAEGLRISRGEELPAKVLRVMVQMIEEGEKLTHELIAEKVNVDRNEKRGEYPISPTKIGQINSSYFNFKTRRVKGVSEILWDSEKAENLCARYGIEYPMVDHVDDVDLSKEE